MKTLIEKLGYRSGTPALLWRVPQELIQALASMTPGDEPSFLLGFARDSKDLAEAAVELAAVYKPGGHLWLAYPKKSGRIPSDLTRDHGWELVAALGLLTVTQVALDEDWSALRFRKREEIKRLTRASEPRDS